MPISKNAKLIPSIIAHNKTFNLEKRPGDYKFNAKDACPKGKVAVKIVKGRQDLAELRGDQKFSFEGMQGYILGSTTRDDGSIHKLVIVPSNDTWCSLVSFPKESLEILYRI